MGVILTRLGETYSGLPFLVPDGDGGFVLRAEDVVSLGAREEVYRALRNAGTRVVLADGRELFVAMDPVPLGRLLGIAAKESGPAGYGF